jgi:acyl-CoA thioester hydrolase
MVSRSDFAFLHPLRVRWSECDAQGIVFNINYFLYYDIAVWEWTRALGFKSWAEAPEFVTAHASADYKGSARFDDELEVGIRAARFGSKSMECAGAVFRGDDLLNVGKLVYVHVQKGSIETTLLAADFLARVDAFERLKPERK